MRGQLLAAERHAQASTRKRVLVVEDNEVIRQVLRLILEGEGYEVIGAGASSSALELARQHRPHVVTLDLALRDGDGRDVLRRLKAEPATRHIPVIVLSALADMLVGPDRSRADEVMTKPFDVDQLLTSVERLCSERERGPQ